VTVEPMPERISCVYGEVIPQRVYLTPPAPLSEAERRESGFLTPRPLSETERVRRRFVRRYSAGVCGLSCRCVAFVGGMYGEG
jgi:hypothetical protein